MCAPDQLRARYAAAARTKVALSAGRTLLLAFLAGVFIALAGVGSALAAASVAAPSLARLVSACVFPTGLLMVLAAGSELFTGNSLLVGPLLADEIRPAAMLRNWGLVYVGNLAGGIAAAALAAASGVFGAFEGAAAASVVATGLAKVQLPFWQALARGVGCNFLVCVAVRMSFGADTPGGKLAAVYLPIMLFVACGFEHSVANMYYIPAAIFTAGLYGLPAQGLGWGAFFLHNLLPVTLGNLIGGMAVGLAYELAYRPKSSARA